MGSRADDGATPSQDLGPGEAELALAVEMISRLEAGAVAVHDVQLGLALAGPALQQLDAVQVCHALVRAEGSHAERPRCRVGPATGLTRASRRSYCATASFAYGRIQQIY
jgi:hypothetical protein